jgi:dephospho-CoA kinase
LIEHSARVAPAFVQGPVDPPLSARPLGVDRTIMPRFTLDNPGPRRRSAGPWRNGPIPVIGVIGGIGAGKSQVASIFVGDRNLLLDADQIGHVLLEQSPSRDRVLERFGEEILEPFGEFGVRREIDRRALGAIVFSRPEALRDLEAILHPAMRKTFEKAISRESRRRRYDAIILDAAILYEAGWDTLCDVVVFVDASPEIRLARLDAARGWTAEVLAAREKVQGPLEEKRRQADHVLTNNGTIEELQASARALWGQLIRTHPRRRRSAPEIPDPAPAARGEPPS